MEKDFLRQLSELYKDKFFLYKNGYYDNGWTPFLYWHCIRHL